MNAPFDLEAFHARFEREFLEPLRQLRGALDRRIADLDAALVDAGCDECGAIAPATDWDGTGTWHDVSCSMHSENPVS